MKTVSLLIRAIVAILAIACSSVALAGSVPDIGGYVVIATMHGSNKVVTYHENAGLVCVENALAFISSGDSPSEAQTSAFTCWGEDDPQLPKGFKELVKKWKVGVPSYGEHRDWPPQQ